MTKVAELAKTYRWPLGIAAFLILIGVGSALDRGPDMDGASAAEACKELVLGRLKAPATAEFSNLATSGSGIRWTVTGSVDAENSFGAKLRMGWSCTVRAQNGEWQLEALTGLS